MTSKQRKSARRNWALGIGLPKGDGLRFGVHSNPPGLKAAPRPGMPRPVGCHYQIGRTGHFAS